MSLTIGLDTGTSATKAVAIDERGNVVASASVEYPLHTPKPGWAEQDPADWRRAALESLRALSADDAVEPTAVKAIGLTGQMHGSVFLDEADRVLRHALLWCDQRTQRECDEIREKVGAENLIRDVLNPALTGFTAPKILWLRRHEPELYARVRSVLLPKDYIRMELTGEKATDVADASGTLLFDVKRRGWHEGILDQLEIPRAWMPEAYEGPEVTGKLSTAAAQETGLPEGIPVVAGGRRPGGGRGGLRDRPDGRVVFVTWNQRCAVCLCERTLPRRGGAIAFVLSCHSGDMAPDGRDVERGGRPPMVSQCVLRGPRGESQGHRPGRV